jgi:autotransporter-associated beta strand protein
MITGSLVTYAGGGGGGARDEFGGEGGGSGGAGGGGAGSTTGSAGNGVDGRGGGGGGRGTYGAGGDGGSGIVIVRYQGAPAGTGGVVTSGSGFAAGYTLHTFSTTGTTTATGSLDLSGVDMNTRLGVTHAGTISGTGGLTFVGPGQLTLAGSNSFTGDTRISSGTLTLGNAHALAASTLDMNASDSGAVTFSQDTRLGGLTGSRAIDNGGHDLLIGGNNASTTYSGTISGSGGLRKQGTGTLTLTGSNTLWGGTTVEAGTLLVGEHFALAPPGYFVTQFVVAASGTLDMARHAQAFLNSRVDGTVINSTGLASFYTIGLTGTGVFGGTTYVKGTHSPGSTHPGVQTFNNLSYDGDSIVNWKLFANSTSLPGVNYDQIVLPTGNLWFLEDFTRFRLNFAGSVDWSDAFWDSSHNWTVIHVVTGSTFGFESSGIDRRWSPIDSMGQRLSPSRGAFSLVQVGQDVVLQFTAVPEPSTCAVALAGLACGGYSMVRRRRRA